MDRPEDYVFSQGDLQPPTVSVVVTSYNYARFIGDCLRSILGQTHKPFECIIVDDASTDDSLLVIQDFIETHRDSIRFLMVPCAENAGQMNAFIEGFRRSSGSFVVFVDADDVLFPDFIETHLAAHLNTRYPAALTCSNEMIIDGDSRLVAGSLEKWHEQHPETFQLTSQVPITATKVGEWRDTWSINKEIELRRAGDELLYVAPNDNAILEFLWSTSSGAMFRRGALDVILKDDVRDVRISADFFLFHYSHLLGGSTLIQTSHGFYRRHGSNNFSSSPTLGRGSRTWKSSSGFAAKDLLHRIQLQVMDDLPMLRELLGEPRMLQLLATIMPTRSVRRVLNAFVGEPRLAIQFLAIFGIKSLKKLRLRFLHLWRYV